MGNKPAKIEKKYKIVIFGTTALAVLATACTLIGSSCKSSDDANLESIDTSSDDATSLEGKEILIDSETHEASFNNSTSDDNIDEDISSEIEDSSYSEPEILDSESNVYTSTISIEGAEPVYRYMTAEDIIEKSVQFAEQLNKEATLSHVDYKFSEIKPTDVYSFVYLANIHNVSKEETQRLIDGGFISDNGHTNVENSAYFFRLYTDDTQHKIREGKTNLIDLSVLLTDENDIEVYNVMNKVILGFINNTYAENYKNYLDTAHYFASGVDVGEYTYDVRDSIYKTSQDGLTLGGAYVLNLMGTTIDIISLENGVYNAKISEILQSGATDFADVISAFSECKVDDENYQNIKK